MALRLTPLLLAVVAVDLPDPKVLSPHQATRDNIAARLMGKNTQLPAGLAPWGSVGPQHVAQEVSLQQVPPQQVQMAQGSSPPSPSPSSPSPPPPPPPPPPMPPATRGSVSGIAAQIGRLAGCRVCLDSNADGSCAGHESIGTSISTGLYNISTQALSLDSLALPIGLPILEPSSECADHITGFPVLAPLRCGTTVCSPLTDMSMELRES